MHNHSILAVVALFSSVVAVAQRDQATISWQKFDSTIDYGVVPVGEHVLSEFEIGQQWRLGRNNATTWTTQLPMVFGESVVAPGQYRLTMARYQDARIDILLDGSRYPAQATRDLNLVGAFEDAARPSEELGIRWRRGDAKGAPVLPATLQIGFGPHRWQADVQLVGGRTTKLGRFRLTTFAVPHELVAARGKRAVPIATLQRGKKRKAERWNLVLAKDAVQLVPWIDVPASNYGFDKIEKPAGVIEGQLTVDKVEADEPVTHVELAGASAKKKRFSLAFAVGREKLSVQVPEPPKPR